MKRLPLVLMALNALVWGALSWMGWDGIKYVESQHVAGFPSTGQIGYYLVFPLLMLSLSLVPGALLGQTKWSAAASAWCGFTLIAVLPYLLSYTGGV